MVMTTNTYLCSVECLTTINNLILFSIGWHVHHLGHLTKMVFRPSQWQNPTLTLFCQPPWRNMLDTLVPLTKPMVDDGHGIHWWRGMRWMNDGGTMHMPWILSWHIQVCFHIYKWWHSCFAILFSEILTKQTLHNIFKEELLLIKSL